MTKIEYSFRPATGADVSKVAALVNAAYGHYVERIGMLPRPMTDDYTEVIANQRVTVAESQGTIVGVIVLTVEGGPLHEGPPGEELARNLRYNGVAAEASNVKGDRRTIGETLLKTSASLGVDLLVKGAYTQSRLRQMIFGGTTSHILAESNLPVFMAH